MKWAVGGIANNKKIYKFYIIAICKFWLALNVFNSPIFCFCAVFEWRQQLILICMKAVCFIKWKKNFCLLSVSFKFFLHAFFSYFWDRFCCCFCKGSRLATRLPRSWTTTCQNTGRAVQPARVRFKLAKSSLWFGTRSLHDPWLTPDNTWDCLTNERKGPKLLKMIQERWLKVFCLREGFK